MTNIGKCRRYYTWRGNYSTACLISFSVLLPYLFSRVILINTLLKTVFVCSYTVYYTTSYPLLLSMVMNNSKNESPTGGRVPYPTYNHTGSLIYIRILKLGCNRDD